MNKRMVEPTVPAAIMPTGTSSVTKKETESPFTLENAFHWKQQFCVCPIRINLNVTVWDDRGTDSTVSQFFRSTLLVYVLGCTVLVVLNPRSDLGELQHILS